MAVNAAYPGRQADPGGVLSRQAAPQTSAASHLFLIEGTLAGTELQQDITRKLVSLESDAHPGCDFEILNARPYTPDEISTVGKQSEKALRLENKLRSQGQMRVERWYTRSCDTVSAYEILMLVSPEGGTDFVATRLEGAEYEEEAQPEKVRKRYVAPAGQFSCEVPDRLPGFTIREHYEEDAKRGFVEFPTDLGMTVVYYWPIPSSAPPQHGLDQASRRELLQDSLENVLIQGIFLPTSPDNKILHREFVAVGEEEMLFTVVLVPGASGAWNVATGEKFDAKVGSYLFVRDEYVFALRVQNNLRDFAPSSQADLESIVSDYKRLLADFYSSMRFAGARLAQTAGEFKTHKEHEDQFVVDIPQEWSAYDPMKFITGGPLGMVIFSPVDIAKMDFRDQLKTMARIDTGVIPSFFVDRLPKKKKMSCKRFGKRETKYVTGLIRKEDKMFGRDRKVVKPLEASQISLGTYKGVRIRGETEKPDGTRWVIDVHAVSDGRILYLFTLRNIKENYEKNLGAYEKAMGTVRLTSGR